MVPTTVDSRGVAGDLGIHSESPARVRSTSSETMKWASTIPSGGGGGWAIWHLNWLVSRPAYHGGLQAALR
jgi:hypothetical protein